MLGNFKIDCFLLCKKERRGFTNTNLTVEIILEMLDIFLHTVFFSMHDCKIIDFSIHSDFIRVVFFNNLKNVKKDIKY